MPLWFEAALLTNGWARDVRIVMADGKIVTIEANVPTTPGDERGCIALPGLCNLHSHAFQRGMAGLAERRGPSDDDFWTWREVMYRFLGRMTTDDVQAITALAYAEMLETGFTRVGEFHYLHNDENGRAYANPAQMAQAVVEAAKQTGIGLTLLPVFYAHGGFGGAQPARGQERFISTPDSFADLLDACRTLVRELPGAIVGVAPHSLRAVTPEELALVVRMAAGGPVHIHAAEQVREVTDCVAWSGQRPVEWLLDHSPVGANWCLIHATHLCETEISRLAASGAIAGLCPTTEANLGDGTFSAAKYLAAGGAFGVGTDSNVLIDAASELRALEYSQRLNRLGRNILASEMRPSVGASLFSGALAGGGQALGTGPSELREGASADIVTLNGRHPSLVGREGDICIDSWIFAARNGIVDRVWRAGEKVVSGGRHLGMDEIQTRYRESLSRLLAR